MNNLHFEKTDNDVSFSSKCLTIASLLGNLYKHCKSRTHLLKEASHDGRVDSTLDTPLPAGQSEASLIIDEAANILPGN